MALVDVIKYEAPDDTVFVWKHPTNKIKVGSQLIVGEGQQAVFVKGGQALDCFDSGTHSLITGNIPILEKLVNLPFGGDTPFSAEVWFVNRTVKRDLKWGTPSPIPLMDVALGFPVSVRAFGRWGARIEDAPLFLRQIVGTQAGASAEKIHSYFVGNIIQNFSKYLASVLSSGDASVLQITALVSDLSNSASDSIKKNFREFGVELVSFDIESINIPEDELEKIQNVFAKSLEVKELSRIQAGGAFSTVKSFEVLNNAASNSADGSLGAMLSAGVGLGAGLPIGGALGQQLSISNEDAKKGASAGTVGPADRIRQLKGLLDEGLITEAQYLEKQNEILKDI